MYVLLKLIIEWEIKKYTRIQGTNQQSGQLEFNAPQYCSSFRKKAVTYT